MEVAECKVHDNCTCYTKAFNVCWYCIDYANYMPQDRTILSPRQIRIKEEKALEHKEKMESEEHKRGIKARKKGLEAEEELIKTFKKYHVEAEKVFLSGALKTKDLCCDVDINVKGNRKKGEVKARKSGLNTVYKFLRQDKGSNYLFYKQDNKEWIVIMPLHEFIDLI